MEQGEERTMNLRFLQLRVALHPRGLASSTGLSTRMACCVRGYYRTTMVGSYCIPVSHWLLPVCVHYVRLIHHMVPGTKSVTGLE